MNNEANFLCSLGAAIQNIRLGVAAEGLTSAWLSGGGEDETNRKHAEVLGYPKWMTAYGTILIGYPAVEQNRRYRWPLGQLLHWNGYQSRQYRAHAQVDFVPSLFIGRRVEERPAGPGRDAGRLERGVHRRCHQSRLRSWRRKLTSRNPGSSARRQSVARLEDSKSDYAARTVMRNVPTSLFRRRLCAESD